MWGLPGTHSSRFSHLTLPFLLAVGGTESVSAAQWTRHFHMPRGFGKLFGKPSEPSTAMWAQDRVKESVKQATEWRNPTGSKKSGQPCTTCGGERPPKSGCEPWHLRKGPKGWWVPRGAACQPCEWADDSGMDRLLWNHWSMWRTLKAEAGERGEPLLIKIPPAQPKSKRSQT